MHYYDSEDSEIVDYEIYSPWGEDIKWDLRGPKPKNLPEIVISHTGEKEVKSKEKYITCIGSAHTFGRFCKKPFPSLLQEKLGVNVLNFGKGGAGPQNYRKQNRYTDNRLVKYISRSEFLILQVMPGRSENNSLFESNGDFGTLTNSGESMGTMEFWRQLIADGDNKKIQEIVEETRANYVNSQIEFLKKLWTPVVLFWFSERTPDYSMETNGKLDKLFGKFPQLVTREMVNEIRKHCEYYVECVTSRGMPQLLKNRFTGRPIEKDIEYVGSKCKKFNGYEINMYYPSPEMHEDATEKLLPVCNQILIGDKK
tara:strand:+ start:3090 stop:4025 length:936 start_codon:yes stop_codon:yes gene_type:complete